LSPGKVSAIDIARLCGREFSARRRPPPAAVLQIGGKLSLAHLRNPANSTPTGGTVVSKILLTSALALAAIGVARFAAADDEQYNPTVRTADTGVETCEMPVTKVYRIKPNFCPQALVYMIPRAVGPSCCCGNGCGPYGIPPIYASGQHVLVRQTPAMQERVKEFLTELGALVEPLKAT
jgi:hypothetical protein